MTEGKIFNKIINCVCILLISFFFYHLFIGNVFAREIILNSGLECGMGETAIGSCTRTTEPKTEGGWTNGEASCRSIANSYSGSYPGITYGCENHCGYGQAPYTIPNASVCDVATHPLNYFDHMWCPRDPSYRLPPDYGCEGDLTDYITNSIYCCRFYVPDICVEPAPDWSTIPCVANLSGSCGSVAGTKTSRNICPPFGTQTQACPVNLGNCGTCQTCRSNACFPATDGTVWDPGNNWVCCSGSPRNATTCGCTSNTDCADGNACTENTCNTSSGTCNPPTRSDEKTVCDHDFATGAANGWCCSGACGTDPLCGVAPPPLPPPPPAPRCVNWQSRWHVIGGKQCSQPSDVWCFQSIIDGNPYNICFYQFWRGLLSTIPADWLPNATTTKCFTNTCSANNLTEYNAYNDQYGYPCDTVVGTSTYDDCNVGYACNAGTCRPSGPVPTLPGQCAQPAPVDPPSSTCAPFGGGNGSVTWEWNAVPDPLAGAGVYATEYEIDIYGSAGTLIIDNSFRPASNFGCSGGGTCVYLTPLPAGTYYSRIRATGTCVDSAWSQSAIVNLQVCPPVPCEVTTSSVPDPLELQVGGAPGTVTAWVSSGLGSATVTRMAFDSYNRTIATVNPAYPPDFDFTSPYSTQVTAIAAGNTAVWATATLSDGRICQSTGSTDTDVTTTALYSISGNILEDTDGDDIGDSPYTGNVDVAVSGIPAFTASGGWYTTGLTLSAGDHSVSFSIAPGQYKIVSPATALIVTVGPPPACSTPLGSCDPANIIDLDVVVTKLEKPWIQSKGSDIRHDQGLTNILPAGKYASDLGIGLTPGVIFTGNSYDPGDGSASIRNWLVEPPYPDIYTSTHPTIPSSYTQLWNDAVNAVGTPTNIAVADLNSSLGEGAYRISGPATISSPIDFASNRYFVIFVEGNLTIGNTINVNPGSIAIFSVKGDITVDRSVGANPSNPSSTTPHLEGVYSADHSFIVDGVVGESNNNCSLGTDRRLNIEGSVIANAGRSETPGGTFENNRSLCIYNEDYPTVTFIERPEFLLKVPSFAKQSPRVWQEIAP